MRLRIHHLFTAHSVPWSQIMPVLFFFLVNGFCFSFLFLFGFLCNVFYFIFFNFFFLEIKYFQFDPIVRWFGILVCKLSMFKSLLRIIFNLFKSLDILLDFVYGRLLSAIRRIQKHSKRFLGSASIKWIDAKARIIAIFSPPILFGLLDCVDLIFEWTHKKKRASLTCLSWFFFCAAVKFLWMDRDLPP